MPISTSGPAALSFLWWRLTHRRKDRIRRAVVEWAETHADLGRDADLRRAVETLRHSPPRLLPYPFTERYRSVCQTVRRDPDLGLWYVEHRGQRLYWRSGRKVGRIPGDYRALLMEQDAESPHRYFQAEFQVEPGSVFADVGSAEGIVALEVVDRVDHLYLFESDVRWQRALEATFRPWRHKVTIVPALVGHQSGPGRVALDDYFRDKRPPDFLKVDVEGAEADVLRGAAATLGRQPEVRVAICAYHGRDDERVLRDALAAAGFTVEVADGYMLVGDGTTARPEFRRGVLRGSKSAAALPQRAA